MEKTYNIVELFSGIGSQAAALKNLGVKINTVGTSEWDVHAIVAYDMIHGGTDIPADIARMSKDELLEKMSHYTFSNSGKAPLEYEALRTYSVKSLRYIFKLLFLPGIPFNIGFYLMMPEFRIVFGPDKISAPIMPMPKTSIHEYNGSVLR